MGARLEEGETRQKGPVQPIKGDLWVISSNRGQSRGQSRGRAGWHLRRVQQADGRVALADLRDREEAARLVDGACAHGHALHERSRERKDEARRVADGHLQTNRANRERLGMVRINRAIRGRRWHSGPIGTISGSLVAVAGSGGRPSDESQVPWRGRSPSHSMANQRRAPKG